MGVLYLYYLYYNLQNGKKVLPSVNTSGIIEMWMRHPQTHVCIARKKIAKVGLRPV